MRARLSDILSVCLRTADGTNQSVTDSQLTVPSSRNLQDSVPPCASDPELDDDDDDDGVRRSYVVSDPALPKSPGLSLPAGVAVARGTRMEPGTPSETEPTTLPDVRDWSELPLDALVLVFARLGPVEILMGSGLVCHAWLQAAKEPELWASLDMANHRAVEEMHGDVLRKMARVAVDRSQGRLQVFSGKHFVTDELLKYISGRSSASLRVLSLVSCHEVSNKGFTELVTSSPKLEDLSLELCPNIGGRHVLESAGRACPQLRRFRLRRECFRFSLNYSRRTAEALGIAAMTGLRSLTLVSSNINNDELVAVLHGCPSLETLCLRDCYKVIADGSLRAMCAGIRTLTLPDRV